MTELEYRVLSYIHRTHNPYWTDVINAMNPPTPPIETDAILRNLISRWMIHSSGPSFDLSRVSLTPDGISWLLSETDFRLKEQLSLQENVKQEQQKRDERNRRDSDEKSQRKADQRSDRIFQIFLVVASALITNLDRLIPWLISLFR